MSSDSEIVSTRFQRSRIFAWALLWAVSGFSVLTLETVWMRQVAIHSGSTAVSAALVMAVFFVCAALGNLLGSRIIPGRVKPLRRYGSFEVLSGICAVLGFLAFPAVVLVGGDLVGSLVLVGPASVASGFGFACLGEAFVETLDQRMSRGGLFYGMNLLGAALGVAAGGVWLPLWFGVTGAFQLAVAVQISAGLFAWMLGRSAPSVPQTAAVPSACPHAAAPLGWIVLIASGCLSLMAQTLLIVWVRQVMEGSVYALCGVLAVFISGLGLGSLAVAGLRRRGYRPLDLLAWAAGSSAFFLFFVPAVGEVFCLRDLALTAGTPSGMLGQAVWRCCLLLPIAFCLGGVFPAGWELVQVRSGGHARVLGAAVAVNKVAAGVGALAAIFWILPVVGVARGAVAVGWGYLTLLTVALCVLKARRRAFLLGGAVLLCGITQSVREQKALGVPSDQRVIEARSGPYGPVVVMEDRGTGSRHILLNSRQRLSGTGQALASQRHQSWVPLLFCKEPRRVLTIGMAAGISAAAALDFPVKELEAVELVPQVVDAARTHFGEWNAALFSDPRAKVTIGDGRHVLEQRGLWDAIVCDLFFGAEEGSALLYSKEFFALCRGHLTDGGVTCLWLPCYQHTPETAGMIVRTFADVFPWAMMVRANFDPFSPVVGLIGSVSPLPVSRDFFANQLSTSWGRKLAQQSPFFRSAEHVRMLLICDLHSAQPSYDLYPPITDDRPLLAWVGPRRPLGKELLHGFPLLDWMGKRALGGSFPSCDLGDTPPVELLNAIRACNYYYAASAAAQSLPNDPRSDSVRRQQVHSYLSNAQRLLPSVVLTMEDLQN